MKLWTYLKSKMEQHPGQKICEAGAMMTFEEMIIYAENFGKKLQGIRCCAILCESEMAAGMALLGCFAAGVTAVPLSSRYGSVHCRKILDAICPDGCITDKGGELQILRDPAVPYKEPEDHPALIMCTSGTTGVPKGAMLTENNIIANVLDISKYFLIGAGDTILIARPLYHCAVLTGEFLTALVNGACIRFYSGGFNPMEILNLLQQYSITVLGGTPTLLSLMGRFKRREDCLKHIAVSGECMSLETGRGIARAFPEANIYHVYGLTEACPRVAYLPPHLFRTYGDCVGIPLSSVELKIVTEQGKPAEVNEIGMLWVKGPNVMAGYYNDRERTNLVIKDGWLCTGDLALFTESGLLKIIGRKDDLIIKGGMNIYPAEIESTLKSDPRVRELYVYGHCDAKLGMQIMLDIAGDFTDSAQVRTLCRELLPGYQMPARINLVWGLPKNGSGKIVRRGFYD